MWKSLIFRLNKTVLLYTSAICWHWAETVWVCVERQLAVCSVPCLCITQQRYFLTQKEYFEDVALVKIHNYVLGGRSLLCWLHLFLKQPQRSQYIPIAKKGFARLAEDLNALSALVNQACSSLKWREMQSLRTFSFVTDLHSPGPEGYLSGEGGTEPRCDCSLRRLAH